ncbi:InlB B-repeat-containing protein, partial [Desulfamplus magnetovallimortis]|uniref:InlB B-repeat-containing protein n=1 Tax=Desulfamplus magnetovallimortis TaxID=1246637 RepID=UPI00164757AD
LTSNAFTRTNYTFNGWNTAADGSGTPYADEEEYIFVENITLYAQWIINIYTITFDSNGGTGTMIPQSGDYNSTTVLNSNSFTRTNYTFNGWNTAANGSGISYANKADYTFTADITLYAQWLYVSPPPPVVIPPVIAPPAINNDTQVITSGTVTNNGEHEDVTVGTGATVTNSGTLTDLNNSGTINGGVVAGDSVNNGVMENVTFPQDTLLDNAGGIIGNADNSGEVFGGTIEGTVTNTGVIAGTSPDGTIDASYTVTISESAVISGGEVAGAVVNNGVLESVTISSNSVISFGNSGHLTGTITIVDDEGVGCVITIPPHVVYPSHPMILTPVSIINYANEQAWDINIEEKKSDVRSGVQVSLLEKNRFETSATLPQVPSYYYLIDGVVFSEAGSKSSQEIDMIIPFDPENLPGAIDSSDFIVLVYDYELQTWTANEYILDGNNVKLKTDFLSAVAIVAEAEDLISITTDQVSGITHISATSGGTVISEGGSTIMAKGVCWSTSSNPEMDDNKTDEGEGDGKFKSIMTKLSPNTKYYVRAYLTSELGTIYGNEYSFTTGTGLFDSYLTLTDSTLSALTIPTDANMNMFGVSVGKSIKIKKGARVSCNYFVANNKVVLEESSSQFKVYRSGATVYFVGIMGTVIKVPASSTAQVIYFSDGRADLSIYDKKVILGEQEINLLPSAIAALNNSENYVDTDISQMPSVIDSYLILTDSSPAFTIPYGAYTQVFGSSGINTLSIEEGAKVDCKNFAGANVVNIDELFAAFDIFRIDTTIYFESQNGTYIEIPATTAFQTLNFQDNSYILAIVDDQIMLIKMIIDNDQRRYDAKNIFIIPHNMTN